MKQEPGTRERGASNIPMTEFGQHQTHIRGRGFAEQIQTMAQAHGRVPRVAIHSSPWDRTQQTSNNIALQLQMSGIRPEQHNVPELAPQSLGELEGQPSDQAESFINRYRTELRDIAPPGKSPLTGADGETYDHYTGRVQPVIKNLVRDSMLHPSTIHIIAAHSSDMKAARELYDPGYSPTDHIEPGRTDLIHVGKDGKPEYKPDVTIGGNRMIIPGVYLQHHGATEFSSARPEMHLEAMLKNILPRRGEVDSPTNPSQGGQSSGTPPPSGQY